MACVEPHGRANLLCEDLVGDVDLNDSDEPNVGELLACRCEPISSNTVNKLADTASV